MRKHNILIGLIIIVTITLTGLAIGDDPDDQCDYVPPPQFLWEGELNPNDFDGWEVVNVLPVSPFQFIQIIENPEKISHIRKVARFVDFFFSITLGYRYFLDGQPYSFGLNSEGDKYNQYHFTDEERKACMKCHQDKIIPQEVI